MLMIWICRPVVQVTDMRHATCHAMSDLDEAANQDSVLTSSTTVFVTVYGKGLSIGFFENRRIEVSKYT